MAKYYYCIANSSTSISSSVISSSTALEFTETTRTIHFNCDNQYAYFVVDKSLGEFSFQVNIFKGGFEDPTEITVNDVVYRSYRSTQKLKGSIDIELINVNVATEYLETQWELRPKTDFALFQAKYIGYNGQRLDKLIRDWQEVCLEIESITDQNSKSITTNTTNIAANTANIATNTSNISANTSDINTLKSKVDALAGGIKLKGRVDSVSLLPATAEIGDLYLVGLTTDTDLAEYLYTSAGHWELLGKVGDIDLSEYAKKTDIPTVPTKVSAFTNDAGYLTEEQYKGTYSKPSGGIPKSDLASAVQTSLGKADTALQSYTEKYTGTYSKPSTGIPKTDLASAVQTSLGLADTALQSYTEKYTGTYSKPSGGIPKTDLASAVQTSLGLADTALQSYTEKYTGTYSKPSGGIPKTDLASAVQTSLGLADTALQSYTEKYTGTYSKPSGGIPKTDLASAVQTSLGLADTALQSYTEKYTGTYSKPSGGIPKTDLASAVQTSLGLADTALQSYTEKYTGTYSKPSGGIPKTDLASAVQTSLGKADTALQSHQDVSGKLDKSGGTMTGNLVMGDGYKSVLMRDNASWRSGIGYDTKGNEALSLWATNSVTRLRWYAGKDMSAMSSGTMMDITPDFEISKADGTAKGYIAGSQIAVKSDIPTTLPASDVQSYAKTGSGITVGVSVPSNAKFTDTTYSVATTSANGLMSSSDKTKLDKISTDSTTYNGTGMKIIVCNDIAFLNISVNFTHLTATRDYTIASFPTNIRMNEEIVETCAGVLTQWSQLAASPFILTLKTNGDITVRFLIDTTARGLSNNTSYTVKEVVTIPKSLITIS